MRTNLVKTLLVALGATASPGAWADNIKALPVTENFESGTGIFTGGAIHNTTAIGNVLKIFKTTATATFDTDDATEGNQAYTLSDNEKVTLAYTAYHGWCANAMVTKMTVANSEGTELLSYSYNNNSCSITDLSVSGATPSGFSAFACNGKSGSKSSNGFDNNAYTSSADDNPLITITISKSGLVTFSFVVKNKGIDQSFTGKIADGTKMDLATISFTNPGKNGIDDRAYAIDNLTISTETVKEPTASYTIDYQLNGTTVATKTGTLLAGATVTADKLVYGSDNQKYFATAETLPTLTLTADGTNTLTVDVRKAYTATLEATTTVNGTSSTTTTALTEADDNSTNWTFAYSLYAKGSDGLYYKADQGDDGKFGETGTFTDGQKIEKSISYTTADQQVVFFSEAEGSRGTNISYSNGGTGNVAAQNKTNRGLGAGTLPAGTYELTANITDNAFRQLTLRDASSDNAETNTVATLSEAGLQTATFTLAAPTTLVICGKTSSAKANQSADFDYVYIKHVATTEQVDISAAGYATYAPAANVALPTGVEAYTVALGDDNKLTTTQLASGAVLDATQGYLLKGAKGTYTFTSTTASATDTDGNALKAAKASVTTDGSQYALKKLTDGKVGFAKVQTNVTIPAGKAYLQLTSEAKEFYSLDEEETTTAITTATATTEAPAACYTLQGTKVAQPQRGLYIKGGKKLLKK